MSNISIFFILCLTALVHGAALHHMYYPDTGPDSSYIFLYSLNNSVTHHPSHHVRPYANELHWLSSRADTPRDKQNVPNAAVKRIPTPAAPANSRATPAPTADPSPFTTVHITDEKNFSLLAPKNPQELISDSENDGVSFCSRGAASGGNGACARTFPEGFITAAAVSRSDDGSWTQVTGCLEPSKFTLSASDDGGQFDVRFPNGAQCTFGGYGASFIEQIEPSAKRFCLRCCHSENDQVNCNSHQDRAGCPVAIPGQYEFPDLGVSCLSG